MRLRHFGRGHTTGDFVVVVETSDGAHTGGLFFNGETVSLCTWTTDNTAAGSLYDEDGNARVDPKVLPDELNHHYDLKKDAREKGLGIWMSQ